MSIDALVYSNLKNKLTSPNDLNELNKYFPNNDAYNFGSNKDAKLKQLDTLLLNAQIKRACCLGTNKITVRIPIFPNANISSELDSGKLMKEYGYYDKIITIPPGSCPAEYDRIKNPNDSNVLNRCEEFYKVYCKNIINEFIEANGKWDLGKFLQYKPECACMVPPPSGIPSGINVVPTCFYDQCTLGNFEGNSVWLDKESRKGKCDLVICQANINMSEFDAGNNIGVQNQIEQKCGKDNSPFNKPQTGVTGTTGQTGTSGTTGVTGINGQTGTTGETTNTMEETLNSTTISKYLPFGIGGLVLCCFCIMVFVIMIIAMNG